MTTTGEPAPQPGHPTPHGDESFAAADVIILTYNSAEYVRPCLRAVAATDWGPLDVVVVDNASSDNSGLVARLAAQEIGFGLTVLPLTHNLGCAGGNNVGWRHTTGDFVVFLNPDTEVTPGFVRELVTPMIADPSIGVTGARIYYPGTRTLQHAGAGVYPNGMTHHYGAGEEDTGQHEQMRDVDYVTGAGFAVRRTLLERIGGFDEDYFPAYFEEVDLCARIRRLGFRVVYVPQAILYHHESVSLTVNSPAFHRLYQRMRIRYLMKNLSLLQWITTFIPAEIRWLMSEPLAKGHRLEQFRAYAEGAWWLLRRALRVPGRY